MSAPLTPEQEREWRASLVPEDLACRLFATLDAARARAEDTERQLAETRGAQEIRAKAIRDWTARAERAEAALRHELWLQHGHYGIYGDDGEMQCAECIGDGCGGDYLREPIEVLLRAASKARLQRSRALAPTRLDQETP